MINKFVAVLGISSLCFPAESSQAFPQVEFSDQEHRSSIVVRPYVEPGTKAGRAVIKAMRKAARAERKFMRYHKKIAKRSGIEFGEYMRRIHLAHAAPRGMESLPLITIPEQPVSIQPVVSQDKGIEVPAPTPVVQKSVEPPKSIEFPRFPVIAPTGVKTAGQDGKSIEFSKDLSSSTGSQAVRISGKLKTPPAGMSPSLPRQEMSQTTTTTTTIKPFIRQKKSAISPKFAMSNPIEHKKETRTAPQALSRSDSGSGEFQDPKRILMSLKQLSPDLDKLIATGQNIYAPHIEGERKRVTSWSGMLNKSLTGVQFDQEDTMQRLVTLKYNIENYKIPQDIGKPDPEYWEITCAMGLKRHAADLLEKLNF